MHTIITLDYELFFGKDTGTVKKNIIDATDKLLEVLNQNEIKAVFFIDVGFIKKLREFKDHYASLNDDLKMIETQLEKLSMVGHDLQLHIHPHWEDSKYKEGKWHVNASRYRLSDWSNEKINEIVSSYKSILEDYTGGKEVFAYRAGGFCIQPFTKLKSALKKNNIWLDSSVFKGGYSQSDTHYYDFKNTPLQNTWRFEEDPLKVNNQGSFVEIPITSFNISPIFYWQLAITRLVKNKKHQPFGEGSSLPAKKKWLFKKLTTYSTECASIDGYKSKHLLTSFKNYSKNEINEYFVILGHPKTLSEYSLSRLEDFIIKSKSENQFSTFTDLVKKGTIEKPQ